MRRSSLSSRVRSEAVSCVAPSSSLKRTLQPPLTDTAASPCQGLSSCSSSRQSGSSALRCCHLLWFSGRCCGARPGRWPGCCAFTPTGHCFQLATGPSSDACFVWTTRRSGGHRESFSTRQASTARRQRGTCLRSTRTGCCAAAGHSPTPAGRSGTSPGWWPTCCSSSPWSPTSCAGTGASRWRQTT